MASLYAGVVTDMDVGAPQDMLEGLKALVQAPVQKGRSEFDLLPCLLMCRCVFDCKRVSLLVLSKQLLITSLSAQRVDDHFSALSMRIPSYVLRALRTVVAGSWHLRPSIFTQSLALLQLSPMNLLLLPAQQQ